MDSELAYRNLNSAEQAAAIVSQMIQLRGQPNEFEELGKETGLGFRVIQRLAQPSRRPKAVSLEVFSRIREAYLRLLRRQVAELSTEIARLEAVAHHDDAACKALVAQAEDIIRKARAISQPNGRR